MSILGSTLPEMPGGNGGSSSQVGMLIRLDGCQSPARVTISFDHGVPTLCRQYPPAPAPAGTPPAARGAHRHRRPPRSWPTLISELFAGWGTTLRVTLVLIVLLGGVATIAYGAVAGLGTAGPLVLVHLMATLHHRHRPAKAEQPRT